MSVDTIEAQVIAFITKAADAAPQRVTLDSQLLDDLGFDGDDAVELFTGIHEQFGTDLTHLYERWSEHFGPEGMPLSAGLVLILVAILGGIVFSNLENVVGRVVATVAAATICALIVVGLIWVARRLELIEDPTPITVGEVVDAVKAGAWPR